MHTNMQEHNKQGAAHPGFQAQRCDIAKSVQDSGRMHPSLVSLLNSLAKLGADASSLQSFFTEPGHVKRKLSWVPWPPATANEYLIFGTCLERKGQTSIMAIYRTDGNRPHIQRPEKPYFILNHVVNPLLN